MNRTDETVSSSVQVKALKGLHLHASAQPALALHSTSPMLKFLSARPALTLLCILHFAVLNLQFAISPTHAQPLAPPANPKIYQPAGAPADPKVNVRWNRFYSYAEATEILQQFAKAHPERCKLESLGKSQQNRELWLLTLTNPKTGDAATKPAFWIDGGIHANELQAVEVPLYTAWYLLEMYGRNEFITRLLDERAFYIMPMMSPDSRDAHMFEPNTTHSPRTGQRPVDDDRDGQTDEDGPDDLDNDGHITQMRVKDPNGQWKPSDEYPDMLVRVKDGEKGSYTLLGQEGLDNDDDGKVNEDGDGSYDPNRDWGWNWQPPYVQGGAFRYPFSLKENRAVADFVMARRNIAGCQSYHNTGGMILRGPGNKDDKYEQADIAVMDQIAKKGEMMLPGYRYINTAVDLYEVFGGENDWFYAMQGIVSFTNELFTPFNYFRQVAGAAGHDHGGGGGDRIMGGNEEKHRFNKYLLFEDGFTKWREFDHPTFGKIEVGGFRKNWTRQPPSFLLEEECHRNMAFTLFHADQLPMVRVQNIESKDLGDGITQVTAIIENTRITPTHTQWDVKYKITPADEATISADGLKVIAGFKSTDRFFQQREEQKQTPSQMKLRTIGGNDVVYVRWLVTGIARGAPVTVKITSAKGGTHQLTQ